jgi:hypothetical protein
MNIAVARNISIELGLPIVRARLAVAGLPTAGMAVPETTVHEDRHASAREYEVGRARQILAMEAKTQA